jgi:hypothetical protein
MYCFFFFLCLRKKSFSIQLSYLWQKTEEFVNVNAMSIVQKRVRPVAEQEEFESRRLWREVTLGLK